ncbi:MAG TPA: methyltransferase domain-containing protein [Methanoregulaceae archaeon]|nr:methyltransferase domain-containing protein [Methanoregulaceae archaeon]
MIEPGDRVLLTGHDRTYFIRAGAGRLSTDLGYIDLSELPGKEPGMCIATHKGVEFLIKFPRPTDFFEHARRSGAPMLPKDIGLVIARTGMNRNDDVLDAGTGSGIAAIYFGNVARTVTTFEHRPEFAQLARSNIEDAGLSNVMVITGDVLEAVGRFDIVHLDMTLTQGHVQHAGNLLRPGGYLACYTPFLEHMFTVFDAMTGLFPEVHAYELIEREMTRTKRGTRPSTCVSHSGYITIGRK